MADDLKWLLDSFNLQQLDDYKFTAQVTPLPLGLGGTDIPEAGLRVYGGQVFSQALQAVLRTVQDRQPHSMHGYFLRLALMDKPIHYHVVNMRDGGSFSVRQVTAIQNGKQVFVAGVSFQAREEGLSYQPQMPKAKSPDDIPDSFGLHEKIIGKFPQEMYPPSFAPLDIRLVSPKHWGKKPNHSVWLRTKGRLPDDPAIHQTMMAYMSDMYLFGSSMLEHGLNMMTPNLQPASLDHTLWFHDEFRADEWLLYDLTCEWTGQARGLNRGRFFTPDGRLVGTTMQEGLMRIKKT